jgi:hypothetical protein
MTGPVLIVVAVIVLGLAFYGLAGGAKRKDDSDSAGPGHDGGLGGGGD